MSLRGGLDRAGIVGLALVALAGLTLIVAAGCLTTQQGAQAAASEEQSSIGSSEGGRVMATATFGAGCFWGVEEEFRHVEGVTQTAVGYEGGTVDNPTYEQVCSHRTGHTEVVQLQYDPEKVSYEKLLEVFWSIHNPTQVNRQGPDVGWQYRSVIFYHTPEQEQAARASLKALDESGKYDRPVATAIEPAQTFWRAEEYHQQYYAKRGGGACPR